MHSGNYNVKRQEDSGLLLSYSGLLHIISHVCRQSQTVNAVLQQLHIPLKSTPIEKVLYHSQTEYQASRCCSNYNKASESRSRLFQQSQTASLNFAMWANKCECTMDQELADAATYAPGKRCICTYQTAALFCMKWRLLWMY